MASMRCNQEELLVCDCYSFDCCRTDAGGKESRRKRKKGKKERIGRLLISNIIQLLQKTKQDFLSTKGSRCIHCLCMACMCVRKGEEDRVLQRHPLSGG